MSTEKDEDDVHNPVTKDGVTPARFKNYKPSIFEQRGLEKSDTTTWRTRMQMSKVKFDDLAKMRFLEHVAKTGRLTHAAAVAGVCPQTVGEHRKNDPEFAQAVDIAKAMYADDVHALLTKLANGVKVPIFGGEFKDEIVGYKMEYATNLVAMEAKRVNPEYRERSEIDIKGGGLGGALVVPAGITPAEWAAQAAARNADHEQEPGTEDE